MRTTNTMAISLSPAMAKQMERVQKEENPTRSELLREGWRQYFETRYPVVQPTKAELAAIRKGRAEIKSGRFVTLEKLLHDLDTPARKPSRTPVRKNARQKPAAASSCVGGNAAQSH
jgi:predicted transcriptional regulator